MKKSKDSFSKQVIIILVIAGGIILWDSFSWSAGGMNGLISMMVAFLAALILVPMVLGRIFRYFFPRKDINSDDPRAGESTDMSLGAIIMVGIRRRMVSIILVLLLLVLLFITANLNP
jgi:hypothetical protein